MTVCLIAKMHRVSPHIPDPGNGMIAVARVVGQLSFDQIRNLHPTLMLTPLSVGVR